MREAGARLIGRDRVGRDVFLRGAGRAEGGAPRRLDTDLYDLIAAYGASRAQRAGRPRRRPAAGDDPRRGDPPARADDRRAARMDRARGASCPRPRTWIFGARRSPPASSRRSSWPGWARCGSSRTGNFSTALREGGMREMADAVRAVEACLFAAEEPLRVEDIAAYVGSGVDVKAALAELEDAIMPAAASSWSSAAGAGISRPPPTSPTSCAASARRAASCRAPPSRRWRSSPITSRSAAPRSRRSGASRSRRGRWTC